MRVKNIFTNDLWGSNFVSGGQIEIRARERGGVAGVRVCVGR